MPRDSPPASSNHANNSPLFNTLPFIQCQASTCPKMFSFSMLIYTHNLSPFHFLSPHKPSFTPSIKIGDSISQAATSTDDYILPATSIPLIHHKVSPLNLLLNHVYIDDCSVCYQYTHTATCIHICTYFHIPAH